MNLFGRLSIRTKLVLIIVTAGLPVAAASGFFLYSKYKADYKEAEHAAIATAKAITQHHNAQVEGIRNLLFTLSLFPEVKNKDAEACNTMIRTILRHSPSIMNIGIVDLKGNLIASGVPVQFSIGDRKYFRDALRTKRFSVGEYVMSRDVGRPAIQFALPVQDSAGNLVAVLFATYDLSRFNGIFDAQKLPADSTFNVSDHRGVILHRYPAHEKAKAGIINRAALRRHVTGPNEEGAFVASGMDGVKKLSVFTQVRLYPDDHPYMYIRVATPEATVCANVNRIIGGLVVLFLLSALLALVVTYLLAGRFFVRSLEHIVSVAQSVTKGDFTVRADLVKSGDELGFLARSFNEMIAALGERKREKEQSEALIKASEEKHHAIFDHMNDAIFIHDIDTGAVLDVNKAMCAMYGYGYDEALTLTVEDLSPGATPYNQREAMARMRSAAEGEPQIFEWLGKHRNGHLFWTEVSMRCAVIGGTDRLIVLARDITERKKAKEAILQQLSFLQTLIDTIPSPILYKDTQGKYLGCNSAFESITGHSKPGIIGKTSYDIVPKCLADMFTETDRALLAKPGVHRCETRVRYIDDTVHDVLFIKSTFTDLEGNVAGLVGVIIDITELKRSEEALRESVQEYRKLAADFDNKQRFLRSLIDSIPDLIFYKDNSGAYLGCNKAFADFAGRAEEKLIGHTDPDIFPKEGAEFFREMDRQAPYPGTARGNEEWVDYADGRRVLLDTLKTPYYDQDGHVLGLIGISRDITERKHVDEERKKLEIQLHHAQKMEAIGQLAGGIAHDFNNILTIIIGYSEIVAMQLDKSNPLRQYVKHVLTSAERASELTGGLLSFSRKQVLHTKPIDLCALVRGMEKMLGRLIREDIDFRTTAIEKELIIMADEGKIEQVLMNLVTNAKDAMPKGGYLSIEVYHSELDERFVHAHGSGEPGSYACLSVSDTGHGMDDETQRKIFDPFFTTKEAGKGTGFGMSIVYGIIKQHNGYINVYSEPDRGTIFRIYLPLISEEKVEGNGTLEVSLSAGGTETILLAEDDNAVRELHRIILEEAGYTVIEAVDGKDAFDKFMENKAQVDILASDVIMPKIDGKTLYEEIRKVRPKTKVLFLSGYTKDIVMDRGILEGEFSFMSKPTKASELLKEVRSILDRH